MTSAEQTTEYEELSGNILGIIDAYRMGAALDARDLHRKAATDPSAPERPPATTRSVTAMPS